MNVLSTIWAVHIFRVSLFNKHCLYLDTEPLLFTESQLHYFSSPNLPSAVTTKLKKTVGAVGWLLDTGKNK